MTIDDKITDEKLQYDINWEVTKISALSPGKTEKYEFFTGEEILPSNQSRIIEQAKLAHSPLSKVFKKQTKTIIVQGKQTDAITKHNKKLEALTNKDGVHKDKEIFNELVKDRFDIIIE